MSDATADIAVLKSKVEDLEQNQAILFERCRTNEKWIAGAGAVLTVSMAILGLVAAVDAKGIYDNNRITTQERLQVFSNSSLDTPSSTSTN